MITSSVLILIFSIPIIGILTHAYLKNRQIELQNLKKLNDDEKQKLVEQVTQLLGKNQQLQERIENLETIITSKDWDFLPPASDTRSSEQKAKDLAKRISKQ